MPKRTICIQNPACLSVENFALSISCETSSAAIPLEDIWVVIMETHQASITSATLASLADAGVGVIFCDKTHMPCGLYLPLAAHSRHAAIVESQLALSKPLKKQLWQRIVRAKIENQAHVLSLLGYPGKDYLLNYAKAVTSGDTTGREAVAASLYFKRYLPEGTRREGVYSSALDYGYAIVRAGIARSAVAGGWLVSQGLHHDNDLNAFNLVDDLIEPFRPLVDLLVATIKPDGTLCPSEKKKLVSIFEYSVEITGKEYSLQTAIEMELDSLKRAVLEKDASLFATPTIVSLKIRDGERK